MRNKKLPVVTPVTIPAAVEVPPITPCGLTIPQASRYSGLSLWAIREAITSRKLEHIKEGKGYVILLNDLDAYLDRIKYKVRA